MTWSIESVRETDLSPAEIYRIYSDPSTWGSWGGNTRHARADGPVGEGSIVHVTAGYGRSWPVLMRRMEPDRFVECVVKPPALTVVRRFELTSTAKGVRIRHEIEVSGRAATFTRLTLKPIYARLLAKETRRLVEYARSHRDAMDRARDERR
jgi:hypothetical protein